MILIALADFHKSQPVSVVMDAIATVRTFASVDPDFGMLFLNDDFRVYGERLDYGIALKKAARLSGMKFVQPIRKLKESKFIDFVADEVRKKYLLIGNYCLLPDQWNFTGAVDMRAIERQLAMDSCNFVLLPRPDDEVAPRKAEKPEFEPTKAYPLWRPHFGNLGKLAEKDFSGVFAWTNGGRFKSVCAKLKA